MIIINEEKRRQKLKDLLQKLSQSQDVLKKGKDRIEIYKELEGIYYNPDGDNFRHFYSDIFSEVSIINNDSTLGNINELAENMKIIKDGYDAVNQDEKKNIIDISAEIIKLYDHTNLEISRINYTNSIVEESKSGNAKTKKMVSDMSKKISAFENEENKIKEQQNEMQKEYITILGIFAAIVLAFTGGMAFSTSVLNNIDKASIYRIVLITLIIGFVFYNLIWLFFDFIRSINGKIIYKRYIFFVVNFIFVMMIILTCIGYKKNWLFEDGKIKEKQRITQEMKNQKK